MNQLLAKRTAAVHKAHIGKAVKLLAKAGECRDKGMECLDKAADCFVEAKKASKAPSMDEVGGLLVKAAEHFSAMEDNQELAAHHIGKVAGAWGMGSGLPTEAGGSIKTNTQAEMTEGDVPEYDAEEPYDGKSAGLYTKEQVELFIKNAADAAAASARADGLQQQVEMLQRMPAGAPRARVFALDKSVTGAGEAAGQNAMGILMKDVAFDQADPDSVNRAAGKMIANMIGDNLAGTGMFGKSAITDPHFRGQAR